MNVDAFKRYASIIDDWEAFIRALERPLPYCIWTNTLRITSEKLLDHLASENVGVVPVGWYPGAFRFISPEGPGNRLAYLAGLYHVQEEVSLLPVVLLDPAPGEFILDCCAAPGNKTAQIAVKMENRGTVLANDRSRERMRILHTAMARLGITNTVTTIGDAADLICPDGFFDRVLADVPCSCEGTSRKYPSVLKNAGFERSMRMSAIQKRILQRAIQLCRPGGRIVYSTCTYAPEENEAVVQHALDLFEDTIRLLPAQIPGFVSSPGLTEWNGQSFDSSMAFTMRVWPHQNDTGGFFVAVFEKSKDGHDRTGSERPTIRLEQPNGIFDWKSMLFHHFGTPQALLEEYRVFPIGGHTLNIDRLCHTIPDRMEIEGSGIPFIRTKSVVPRLTTAGAMLIGSSATKNVVQCDRTQAEAYLSRKTIRLPESQVRTCTGAGHVIVRFENVSLGTGFFRPLPDGGGELESLYPKSKTLR